MNCAVLFSGGKDSAYAAYLAQKNGLRLACLLTVISSNPESYMFHTPNISQVDKQAEAMDIPLLVQQTPGVKEKELEDLRRIIRESQQRYDIQGVITGAVESAYQASRVKKICNELDLDCFNPLWQKDQFELLTDLLHDDFMVMITGVFAYPLDASWLGRIIDRDFIMDAGRLYGTYRINPAGEGGEFETFVLNCPLFKNPLRVVDKKIRGSKNSWTMDIELA